MHRAKFYSTGRRCFIPGSLNPGAALVPCADPRLGWEVRRLDWLGRPRGEVVERLKNLGYESSVHHNGTVLVDTPRPGGARVAAA